MRKELPIFIGLISGLIIITATFFSNVAPLVAWKGVLDRWFQIASAWMVFLGVFNLLEVHSKGIKARQDGWIMRVWLIICMFGVILMGIFVWGGLNHPTWKWIYNVLIAPMNATVFCDGCVYTASAAYRTFVAATWKPPYF